jgi:DNA-binding response OmpR family regulator
MTPQPICGSIVVVEDPFVSGFLRNVLQRRGYRVISMEAGDGVNLLRSGDRGVGLVITNIPSVFTEFAERVPLLYLSAYPDPEAASPFRYSRVLRKPFHPEQLLSFVEQLLQPM